MISKEAHQTQDEHFKWVSSNKAYSWIIHFCTLSGVRGAGATTLACNSTQPLDSASLKITSCVTGLSLNATAFGLGCAAIALGILSIFVQLVHLLWLIVFMSINIFGETGKWKSWGKAPCPTMWKDALEDEVWWF